MSQVIDQAEKTCSGCKRRFPATAEYFQRDQYQKDGFFAYCKPCASKKRKERYWKNPEKWRAKAREYSYREAVATVSVHAIKNLQEATEKTIADLRLFSNSFEDGSASKDFCIGLENRLRSALLKAKGGEQ